MIAFERDSRAGRRIGACLGGAGKPGGARIWLRPGGERDGEGRLCNGDMLSMASKWLRKSISTKGWSGGMVKVGGLGEGNFASRSCGKIGKKMSSKVDDWRMFYTWTRLQLIQKRKIYQNVVTVVEQTIGGGLGVEPCGKIHTKCVSTVPSALLESQLCARRSGRSLYISL